MSYAAVLAALDGILAGVAGVEYTLRYVPLSIQGTPMVYSVLESAEVLWGEGMAKTPGYRYRIRHRLVLLWQDNEQAELEVAPFVNAIPEAVHAAHGLGGVLRGGISQVVDVEADWEKWNGVLYRVVDFISETLEEPA